MYQATFFEGDMALNRAWQEIPGSQLLSIADTVRTRLLTFVLELKGQSDEENVEVDALQPSTVQTLVQMTIIGGNNVFGDVQQFASQTVQVGDLASLRGTLAPLGFNHEQLAELESDMQADQAGAATNPGNKELGNRTLDWIQRHAKSAGKGAIKIGSEVAVSVVTEAIKRYLGLAP